jgi:hypothetical protein
MTLAIHIQFTILILLAFVAILSFVGLKLSEEKYCLHWATVCVLSLIAFFVQLTALAIQLVWTL